MSVKTFGVIGHIVVDVALIPFTLSAALGVFFAGVLGLSTSTIALALALVGATVVLVADIVITLALGVAPPGSRRAAFYQ
jgi:hypothetical protein